MAGLPGFMTGVVGHLSHATVHPNHSGSQATGVAPKGQNIAAAPGFTGHKTAPAKAGVTKVPFNKAKGKAKQAKATRKGK